MDASPGGKATASLIADLRPNNRLKKMKFSEGFDALAKTGHASGVLPARRGIV